MTKISIFIIFSSIICGAFSYIPKSAHDRVKRWENGGNMGTGDMSNMFRGTAGVDYPDFKSVPNTSFRCEDQELYEGGLYADVETRCQVYHVCHDGRKDSFICGRGTIFNQQILACDYWYSAECDNAPSYYYLNSQIGNSVSSDTYKQNYPNGNQPNYSNRNQQNHPSGNQQNHPSGNQQNHPNGNQQNHRNGNQQNHPNGNQQNHRNGNQQNYPNGNQQISGRTGGTENRRQVSNTGSYDGQIDPPCQCIKNSNAKPWSFPAFPGSTMHGSDR